LLRKQREPVTLQQVKVRAVLQQAASIPRLEGGIQAGGRGDCEAAPQTSASYHPTSCKGYMEAPEVGCQAFTSPTQHSRPRVTRAEGSGIPEEPLASWEAILSLEHHWQQLSDDKKGLYAQMAMVVRYVSDSTQGAWRGALSGHTVSRHVCTTDLLHTAVGGGLHCRHWNGNQGPTYLCMRAFCHCCCVTWNSSRASTCVLHNNQAMMACR
jgi:hypothetical protein